MLTGDYAPGTILYGKFSGWRPSTGSTYGITSAVVRVYKDNSTTESSAGVSLTTNFDGLAGLHHFAIDTSADGTFYSSGSNFDVVLTSGTVDGVDASGTVVGSFTLNKTAAVRPATAGRTVTLDASGQVTVGAMAAGTVTASAVATGAIDADALATDAVQEIADGILDRDFTSHTTASTPGKIFNQLKTALSAEYQGAITGGTPTTTKFIDTNLPGTVTDYYKDRVVIFTSGAISGQAKAITAYNGTTHEVTTGAFTTAPSVADTYIIV